MAGWNPDRLVYARLQLDRRSKYAVLFWQGAQGIPQQHFEVFADPCKEQPLLARR